MATQKLNNSQERHIISILMENESGALSKVINLFSARGYNIESLSVAPTDDRSLSRLTLVTHGDAKIIEQITKLLNRLIDVVKLIVLTDSQYVEREMMLIKVMATTEKNRAELFRLNEMFRGRVLDVTPSTFVIEMTGNQEKLNAFISSVNDLGIVEIDRSGSIGLTRGTKGLLL